MFAINDEVIPALARGQIVCSNIEGWGDPERIEKLRQLVIKRHNKPADFAIDVRHIPHSVLVSSGNVFPRDMEREDADGTRLFDDTASLVPFGALLVWDEAKAFTTDHMHKAAKDIVAYHGHWGTDVHPFNILLIYQHWNGFAPIVRANVEKVRVFKKAAAGGALRKKISKLPTIFRWTIDNPGDVAKLPLNKPSTICDKLKVDPEVGATYKSTRAEEVADDNIKLSFWQTEYFKKKVRLILILGVVGVIAQYFMLQRYIEKSGAKFPWEDKAEPAVPGQAVAGAPGATQSAATGLGVAPSVPVIAGVLPSPGGQGYSVLIRDGDRYEVVDGAKFRGAGEAMSGPYRGQTIYWGVRY